MKKYKIQIQITQEGRETKFREEVIECWRPPRIGEGRIKTVDPPICEKIVSCQEVA